MKAEYVDEYENISESEKSLNRLLDILKYINSDYIDVKEIREELKTVKRIAIID